MSVATGQTYTLGWVVNEIMDKNLRLFPILFKQFSHIQYAFFDVKQLAGQGWLSLKPKEIPGIESSITVDGFSIKWLDYSLFDFNTTVKGNQSLTASSYSVSIDVTSSAGFSVNDTVYWVAATGSDEFDGIVTAVTDADTIVVKLTSVNGVAATATNALTLVAGSVIERWFWTRNDNDEILRPSASYNYKEYQSYIQHFSRRIEFTKAELNKEYKYEMDAKNEAQKRFEYNLWILFQEVNKALYKGENKAPGAGANDKMQMLGFETICREAGTIIDLGSSTKPVKDLMAQLELAFRSGAVLGNEPLMLLVNDRFLSELANSNADKVRYDKYVDVLKMTIPTLSTIFGEVDIIRDPMLNRLYSYAVAFTVPRSLVKLWVRENQSFEPKRGITRADQSVRIFPVIHNLREKELYDMEFELWLVAGWISSSECPYRMLKNFAS